MDNERVARELVQLAGKLVKAAVVYKVPFKNYAGQLVGIPAIKKEVEKAVEDYDIHSEVAGRIMRAMQKEAQDIDDGKKIEVDFQVPVSIQKDKDGRVRIQFQT